MWFTAAVAFGVWMSLAVAQQQNATVISARAILGGHAATQTYFVLFKSTASQQTRKAHLNWIESWTSRDSHGRVAQGMKHTYEQSISGYSAHLTPEQMQVVMSRPEVSYMDHSRHSRRVTTSKAVAHSQPVPAPQPIRRLPVSRAPVMKNVQTNLMVANGRSWNSVRVSHRVFTSGYRSGPYVHNRYLGQGTTVYVLDSGISDLSDFSESRITVGRNFVRGSPNADLSGHGTMVSALIASRSYGLAPGANLTSLKVSNDHNTVSSDDLLAALEYIISTPGDPHMKIISLSQYFPRSPTIDAAFDAVSEKGIHIVVAAGNDGKDACSFSPGRASRSSAIITVGSIDGNNAIPIRGRNGALEGSNVGSCVSIFAPGSRVPTLSSKRLAPNTLYFGYGTSIATPQVASLVSVLLSEMGPTSPAELKKVLISRSLKGQIVGWTGGSSAGILWNGLA